MSATKISTSHAILALFVGLSIVGVMSVMPAFGDTTTMTSTYSGTRTTYSCTVSVSYSSTSQTFTVKSIVTATNGYLPGPSETDYLQSYHSGTLYNTQSVKYSIGMNQATITMSVPVSGMGMGTYTFSSTILNSKGTSIASCSGTYTL